MRAPPDWEIWTAGKSAAAGHLLTEGTKRQAVKTHFQAGITKFNFYTSTQCVETIQCGETWGDISCRFTIYMNPGTRETFSASWWDNAMEAVMSSSSCEWLCLIQYKILLSPAEQS